MTKLKVKRVIVGRFALVLLMLSVMMVAIPGATASQSVVGTVTDAITGLPISGAAVNTLGSIAVSTDSTGGYSIDIPSAGSHDITFSKDLYYSNTINVNVPGGTIVTQSVQLTHLPGIITGTVTDSVTGLPISGADVIVGTISLTTNSIGVYSTNVAEGTYNVAAGMNKYDSNIPISVAATWGNTTTCNIALVPHNGDISGVVSDASTHAPVSGATVSAGGATVTADVYGNYDISIVEGTYTVTASKMNYTAKAITGIVVIPESAIFQNIKLEHNGIATGRITDALTGFPISGASVVSDAATATTDSSGVYKSLSIGPGTDTLVASYSGYDSKSVSVSVASYGTAIADISLNPKNGIITGKVTDALTSGPISGATVVAGGMTAYTNSAGIYSINIAEGTYNVTISATTYQSIKIEGVIVKPGSTVTNNVALSLPSVPIDQTITFGILSDKKITDAPFVVSATASSRLPVSFSIVSGPATISGNTVTITGTGLVTVRASQAGNVSYNAAPNVDRTFNVTSVATPKSSITVTSPNGGEKWKHGTIHTIKWSKTGSPGTNVKIELLKAGALNRVIIASKSGTSYSWTIPATQTPGTNYKIRITSTSNSAYKDTSNNNFIIVT